MSRSDDLALIESGMLSVQGVNNTVVRSSKVLTTQETGFVLADASAGQLKITLPVASRPMDVRIQRVDNTANRLLVYAASGEKIKFHAHLRPEGYPFCMVLGGGDFWHLRSDGAGSWVMIDRLDKTSVGRAVFDTSIALSPGGWGTPDGVLLNRTDWPWLWDHALQSGMLTNESSRAGMEGCWTSGDGSTTFRLPELRGEFLRALDLSRGLDAGRVAGSRQKGSLVSADTGTGLGVWIPAMPAAGLTTAQTQAGAGFDPIPLADYPGVRLNGIASSDVDSLPGQAGNWAAAGVSRPRNIAYPIHIKLI